MRVFLLVPVALAACALAAGSSLGHIDAVQIIPEIAGDDVFSSQPFEYAALANGLGFSNANSWMVADDFTYSQDGIMDFIQIWAIYSSGNPTSFVIQIRNDTGSSGPGAIHAAVNPYAINHFNTGLTQWGYALWYTEINTYDAVFYAGTKYWLALQTVGGAGAHYWLAALQTWADMNYFSQDNGNSWASSQSTWGTAYESFMVISGSTSLTRDTWGSIKALF
jgi:hypothetical protein